MSCVFCEILAGDAPASVVFEDDVQLHVIARFGGDVQERAELDDAAAKVRGVWA